MTDDRAAWLAGLRPGDEVAVKGMMNDDPVYISTIAEIQNGRLYIENADGIRRPYHQSTGLSDSKWELSVIFPATQGLRDDLERKKLIDAIEKAIGGLSLEKLRAIWAIVRESNDRY